MSNKCSCCGQPIPKPIFYIGTGREKQCQSQIEFISTEDKILCPKRLDYSSAGIALACFIHDNIAGGQWDVLVDELVRLREID